MHLILPTSINYSQIFLSVKIFHFPHLCIIFLPFTCDSLLMVKELKQGAAIQVNVHRLAKQDSHKKTFDGTIYN